MPQVKNQVESLNEKASEFCVSHGQEIVRKISFQSAQTTLWLPFLNNYCRTGVADELLDGLHSSLMEAAACAAIGFIRPALFSMRTEIDLALGWLFFKDHRVEWATVNATGDGFRLKKEIFEYLDRNYIGFTSRFGILKQIITRRETDTYRLLSAHIHAQSAITMPTSKSLRDVVKSPELGLQCGDMAHEVDEYINDLFICAFANNWSVLPPQILASLNSRFKSQDQKAKFFELI
ncbi:MAG: hypothetical protein EOP06_25015 [Proteobacteria bacterium]|nr:MAG: hypothetical protein EOP06_25015 [Pseudomonadota bacterium]